MLVNEHPLRCLEGRLRFGLDSSPLDRMEASPMEMAVPQIAEIFGVSFVNGLSRWGASAQGGNR